MQNTLLAFFSFLVGWLVRIRIKQHGVIDYCSRKIQAMSLADFSRRMK